MNKQFFKVFVCNLILTPIILILLYKIFDLSGGWQTGFALLYLFTTCAAGAFTFEKNLATDENFPNILSNTKSVMLATIVILFLTLQIKRGGEFYNQATSTEIVYQQNCTARVGFYDKMWKTYRVKNTNTNLNKEMFTSISSMLLENRKDGPNVTWKWLQETRQIPFNEFTAFYQNMSSYFEEQREGYYQLEVDCQKSAANYNICLKKFPNNIYNIFIGKKPIIYKYGFTSDSTQAVFAKGIEN